MFFSPCVLLAQDTKVMTAQAALINAVLETTANYLEHKNDVNPVDNLPLKKIVLIGTINNL